MLALQCPFYILYYKGQYYVADVSKCVLGLYGISQCIGRFFFGIDVNPFNDNLLLIQKYYKVNVYNED